MGNEYAIWPPGEAFYIESMLTLTLSAVDSANALSRIFNDDFDPNELTEQNVLDMVQNIVAKAAALSRYFWTSRPKEQIHSDRSEYLRKVFEVDEGNVLQNRKLRNSIEHFDENLDLFLNKVVVGTVVPSFVGVEPEDDGVPRHMFRAFYNRTGVFHVMGLRLEVQPIVDEVFRLHRKLVSFAENGYRMSPN